MNGQDRGRNAMSNFNTASFRFTSFLNTNGGLGAFAHDRHARPDHIPGLSNRMNSTNQHTASGPRVCCCGRLDCAYLEHNNTALGLLERDLETAARLGQVRALCMDYQYNSHS